MFSNFTSRVHLCDACAQTRSLHGCQPNTPEIYLSPSFALPAASRRLLHAVCATWRCFENNGTRLGPVCRKHGVEVRNLISRSGVLASVTRTRLRGRQPPGGPGRDAAHTAAGAWPSPPRAPPAGESAEVRARTVGEGGRRAYRRPVITGNPSCLARQGDT